ncbi:MAG: hypothetical protein ABI112_05865 [Terracoccus sp.]
MADRDGRVVGTLQLSVAPGLSRRGATRCTVEESRRLGASLVQLTSDATRVDDRRFYENRGSTASHVGVKRALD